jgi:hypothetical protein
LYADSSLHKVKLGPAQYGRGTRALEVTLIKIINAIFWISLVQLRMIDVQDTEIIPFVHISSTFFFRQLA